MDTYTSWVGAWTAFDRDDHVRVMVKNLAFLSRYGRVPPSEAARYPRRYLQAFCDAIDELLTEERKGLPGGED